MPEINIGQGTRLQDLQQFLTDPTLQDGHKLQARTEIDGSLTLYTSEHRNANLFDKITGQITGREQRARDALTQVFGNEVGNDEFTRPALSNILDTEVNVNKLLRVSDLREVVQKALDAQPQSVQLREIDTAFTSQDPVDIQRAVDTLRAQVLALPEDQRKEFALSNGEQWKSEMSLKLSNTETCPPALHRDDMKPGSAGHDFLSEIFDKAMAGVMGDQGRIMDNDNIMLNGHQYTKVKNLGEGGFGKVDLYARTDGSGHEVALKTPALVPGGKNRVEEFDKQTNELSLHQKAWGEGSEHVVGYEGFIRMDDGRVCMALEPGGKNLEKLISQDGTLKTAMEGGHLDGKAQELVQKTLLKEMLQGLDHMHQQGMIHRDVKPQNFLLGTNGQSKLLDFGESLESPKTRVTDRIDCPIWLAPEIMVGKEKLDQRYGTEYKKEITTKIQDKIIRDNGLTAANLSPEGNVKGKFRTELRELVDDKYRQKREDHGFKVSQKVDSWSMGVVAFQIFNNGQEPFPTDTGFQFEVENKVKEHTGDKFDQHPITPDQDFVNQMLSSDPKKRPTLQEAMEHPLLKDMMSGVPEDQRGEVQQQVHQLILALGDNDMPRVKELSDAINERLG